MSLDLVRSTAGRLRTMFETNKPLVKSDFTGRFRTIHTWVTVLR